MELTISVIIPTFNEETSLSTTINTVKTLRNIHEIIVVDGGSQDETITLAQRLGAIVIHSERGRGTQLKSAANHAAAEVLWFLHADTRPTAECEPQIQLALQNTRVLGGNFTIVFEGETAPARFMTWLYPKLRKIGLVYGDSGIFVRREIYASIGGFKQYPLFEDLDFYKRATRLGFFAYLPAKIITSTRRFSDKNFVLMFTHWSLLQVLYWLGVSPYRLVNLYLPIRARKRGKN